MPSWVFGMSISELGCSGSSNLALLFLTLLWRSDLPDKVFFSPAISLADMYLQIH